MNAEKTSFWHTLPGILTASATLLTATVGAYVALKDGSEPGGETASAPIDTTAGRVPMQSGLVKAAPSNATAAWADWPVIGTDDFENSSNWRDNDYSAMPAYSRFVTRWVNGAYRYELTANEGWWSYVPSPYGSSTDMYVEVDVRVIDHTPGVEAVVGLVFGGTADAYYSALLSTAGQLVLARADSTAKNQDLLPSWINVRVDPATTTKIGVLVEGDLFQVFVNGQFVSEVRDRNYRGGTVAISAGVRAPGSVVAVFDNFELRRKPR
jgi:hypothetical protein